MQLPLPSPVFPIKLQLQTSFLFFFLILNSNFLDMIFLPSFLRAASLKSGAFLARSIGRTAIPNCRCLGSPDVVLPDPWLRHPFIHAMICSRDLPFSSHQKGVVCLPGENQLLEIKRLSLINSISRFKRWQTWSAWDTLWWSTCIN